MFVNLGVFVLIWESVAVVAMVGVRLLSPEAPVNDLFLTGAAMAPFGIVGTWFLNRIYLGFEADAEDEPEPAESLFAAPQHEDAADHVVSAGDARPA